MAKALPIESKRAEVSREELAAFYTNLREQLADAKPELVFNMDEVGFRGARLKCFTCVATRDYEGKLIEADRRYRHNVYYDRDSGTGRLMAATARDKSLQDTAPRVLRTPPVVGARLLHRAQFFRVRQSGSCFRVV